MSNDFTMFAGDSRTITVTVKNDQGAAVDITGATLKWQAAPSVSGAAVISKTSGSGIDLTSPSTGVFTITLDGADTDALGEGVFYHEAEMVLAGDTSTVLTGSMVVEKTLIRAS